MRRTVGAGVVVPSVSRSAMWHGAHSRFIVVVVTVAKPRGGATVCVRTRDRGQEKVEKVTVGHDALLQATRATRQAMRGANIRSENKRTNPGSNVLFPVTFVCQFAC